MVEQELTESGKEFQIAGPADLKPREPNTELTCGMLSTGRAEGARRNIGTNEG